MKQVNPNSGPYQGGTEDIINVTVGGALCVIYSDIYQPGVG